MKGDSCTEQGFDAKGLYGPYRNVCNKTHDSNSIL